LARKHDDLAPMMTFVRNEVRKHMPNIERQIAPRIRSAGWDGTAMITAQRQEADYSAAAPVQRRYELPWADPASIDRLRHGDPMLLAQSSNPHASRVMDVAGDHPDCPSRGARDDRAPQLRG
jgi:hypothetical protein